MASSNNIIAFKKIISIGKIKMLYMIFECILKEMTSNITPRMLDQCHTCDFIARLSCSMQLCMSHTATLSHKQEITNWLGQCLFMQQSCSVQRAQLPTATLSRNKVMRQNRTLKSHV